MAEDCRVRQDIYRDARPSNLAESVLRLTCLTHGLVASSDSWVGTGASMALAQATQRLEERHR